MRATIHQCALCGGAPATRQTPCGRPVCDGCNEECHDFEDCPRPAPGQRCVSTDHVECLDCALCEYTDEPQVQDYSDADPGL